MSGRHRHLYTAAQVREIDRRAIEQHGYSGYGLMQAAALACWRTAAARWPATHSVIVVCGSGNNGGDGYEIARLARRAGAAVRVYSLGPPAAGGEAAQARSAWLADGGTIEPFDGALPAADLVVDALFGTGLSRALSEEAGAAIRAINQRHDGGARVLAVDVPSGLDATTGALPSGIAVQADATLSFIARKLGLHTGAGPDFVGDACFDPLDVPDAAYDGIAAVARLQSADDLRLALPPRKRTAHKGDHGHVLIVGGNDGMAGAVLLAARAALRTGAGLVTVATRQVHAAALTAAQPELMCRACEDVRVLRELLRKADVVAIGPGLGSDAWAAEMLSLVLQASVPRIFDADALNLLAIEPAVVADAILTPHPGEAARLLHWSTGAVQADRLGALRALEQRYAAVAILKGAGSLSSGSPPTVCANGNPGMAVGGMGDVLTGIVAALRAQALSTQDAAQTGVLVHAVAGDRAARQGERGMLPTDLIEQLRAVVNPARG